MENKLQKAIAQRQFLVTAEIAPPKGADPTHMLQLAELLKNRVHGINVTDGSRAVMRMSSLTACVLLKQMGIEPICQMTCRDRNSIALQADLLGASALGVNNILALTGDPVKAGDHQEAKAVFELESVRFLKLINNLNQGLDINQKLLPDGTPQIFPGGAIDPQLKSWSSLQKRFEQKIEAGAQFFQSQLITDFDRLDKFMTQIASTYNKPILAGIFLLKSAKNAKFINRYVPGVNIPDSTIQRLQEASDPLQEGVKIAAEQVKMAREICQGVHLMAVKTENFIPQILDLAGVSPLFASP
jgi:methylenetetrahydrofolate reductase (NADPH)